jgi:hypothetical protein
LIVAVGENREHRRDAYDTLGWATFEAEIDKGQKEFASIKALGCGKILAFGLLIVAVGENRGTQARRL